MTRTFFLSGGIFLALTSGAGRAAVPVWSDNEPAALTARLHAGEFVWNPQAASAGAVSVIVSLPTQIAYVYRGGDLIGMSTVSTGKPGHSTPKGDFTILQKQVTHHSNKYSNAPMPYMQRLTWDGVAMHAGTLPGHPASHGCIRLPRAFAQALYAATSLGAMVTITPQPLSTRLAYGDGRLVAVVPYRPEAVAMISGSVSFGSM